jgi:hypothetical protein
MISGSSRWMRETLPGVSETTLVRAVSASPPRAEMAFKSACIPAPQEESDPAMVKTGAGEIMYRDQCTSVAKGQEK